MVCFFALLAILFVLWMLGVLRIERDLPTSSEQVAIKEKPAKPRNDLAKKPRKRYPPGKIPESIPERFVVFDFETTGLNPEKAQIIEIAAIISDDQGKELEKYTCLVASVEKVPKKIQKITGITTEMIEDEGIDITEALEIFKDFIGNLPLIAHNAPFDVGFLRAALEYEDIEILNDVYCTLALARKAWPHFQNHKLGHLCERLKIEADELHRALADVRATKEVFLAGMREIVL